MSSRHCRYDAVKARDGLTDVEMASSGVLPIAPGFRVAALAEPPVVGGTAKEQWMTAEVLSMFLFHQMRPLSESEERRVLTELTGRLPRVAEDVLGLTHQLRASEDASLRSIANSLSTRQLLRVCRRVRRFPDERAHAAVHKACLARFLPSLPKEALERTMEDAGIVKMPEEEIAEEDGCVVTYQNNNKMHKMSVLSLILFSIKLRLL